MNKIMAKAIEGSLKNNTKWIKSISLAVSPPESRTMFVRATSIVDRHECGGRHKLTVTILVRNSESAISVKAKLIQRIEEHIAFIYKVADKIS